MIKRFLSEEDALGTVELLLILAALVSIALIFKRYLVSFIDNTGKNIFDSAGEGATIENGTNVDPAVTPDGTTGTN